MNIETLPRSGHVWSERLTLVALVQVLLAHIVRGRRMSWTREPHLSPRIRIATRVAIEPETTVRYHFAACRQGIYVWFANMMDGLHTPRGQDLPFNGHNHKR